MSLVTSIRQNCWPRQDDQQCLTQAPPPDYVPPPLPDLDEDGRPPTQTVQPLPPGSRLPYQPNPFFTGRETELGDLALALLYGDAQEGEHGGVAPTMVISTGIGGVGKTQLAAEFAHRWGRYFSGVHWVSLANPDDGGRGSGGVRAGDAAGPGVQRVAHRRQGGGRQAMNGPNRSGGCCCSTTAKTRTCCGSGGRPAAGVWWWSPAAGSSWPPSLGVRTRHLDPFDVPESVSPAAQASARRGRPPAAHRSARRAAGGHCPRAGGAAAGPAAGGRLPAPLPAGERGRLPGGAAAARPAEPTPRCWASGPRFPPPATT